MSRAWAAWGWLLLAWLCMAPVGSRAQDLQPVPPLSTRVTDTPGVLTAPQRAALEAKLASIEQDLGSQVVVLLVATTQPEDIASYAHRVADQWKVGRRDIGDGVLVLVARDDRRVRIEVAKALEGAVPDLAARQIIDRYMRPAFQVGDFAGGLNAGVDALAARVRGEGLPSPAERPRGGSRGGGFDWEALAMFFFVGVPVVGAVLTGVFGRRLGSMATAGAAGGLAWWLGAPLLLAGLAGVLALILVGVMGIGAAGRRGLGHGGGVPIIWGGGGFGGGGGGGGGFSSGGGGDFGGGGASGDW